MTRRLSSTEDKGDQDHSNNEQQPESGQHKGIEEPGQDGRFPERALDLVTAHGTLIVGVIRDDVPITVRILESGVPAHAPCLSLGPSTSSTLIRRASCEASSCARKTSLGAHK